MHHDVVHALQHFAFVAFGFNMWMALLGPLPKPPWFGNLARLGYILAVRLTGAVLGNVFVFGGHVFFGVYAAGERAHGISPGADQNAAGAIMMVEGSILTLALFGWLFARAAQRGRGAPGAAGPRRRARRGAQRGARGARGGRRARRRAAPAHRVRAVTRPSRIWTTSTDRVGDLTWRPVRRALGATAFGVSAWTADAAGDELIESHAEGTPSSPGHEELYLVRGPRDLHRRRRGDRRAARARSCSSRSARAAPAVAAEPDTTVLVIGGEPGAALPGSAWEHYYAAQPAYDAGDYDRAVAIASEGLGRLARPRPADPLPARLLSRARRAASTTRARIARDRLRGRRAHAGVGGGGRRPGGAARVGGSANCIIEGRASYAVRARGRMLRV